MKIIIYWNKIMNKILIVMINEFVMLMWIIYMYYILFNFLIGDCS